MVGHLLVLDFVPEIRSTGGSCTSTTTAMLELAGLSCTTGVLLITTVSGISMDFAGFAGSMMGDLQRSQTGGCVTGDGKTGMSSSMRLRLRVSLTLTGISANWSGTSSVASHNLSRLTWTVSSFFFSVDIANPCVGSS